MRLSPKIQRIASAVWPVTLVIIAVVAPWAVYKSVKESR